MSPGDATIVKPVDTVIDVIHGDAVIVPPTVLSVISIAELPVTAPAATTTGVEPLTWNVPEEPPGVPVGPVTDDAGPVYPVGPVRPVGPVAAPVGPVVPRAPVDPVGPVTVDAAPAVP